MLVMQNIFGEMIVKYFSRWDPNNPVFSKNVNFSEIDRILCKNYRRFRI